jgi:hypothetical protein
MFSFSVSASYRHGGVSALLPDGAGLLTSFASRNLAISTGASSFASCCIVSRLDLRRAVWVFRVLSSF